ncbi:MAG: hypothetical protein OET63_06590, partial [Desulfobacterales bacterium]|nr:hypothetical protein [Desulfobacterales bacterium]
FDSDSGAGIQAAAATGGSGYYVVTAVDSGGTESAQSLAVRPAAMASAGSGSSSIVPGCFIESVSQSTPQQSIGFLVLLIVGIAVYATGIRRQVSGLSRKMRDFMS